MEKSEFHLRKALLKTEISMHEKMLEEKFHTTIHPQNMLLKILPSVAKRFLNFEGKELSSSFAEKINKMLINVLLETQKVIAGVSHLLKMFQDFKSILKEKKSSKEE
tara:strand:+ start:19673 stop:19993 length:321 start_codon:yes stop_codon:yes gene_type:complete